MSSCKITAKESGLSPDAAVLEHAPHPAATTQTLLQNTKILLGQDLTPAQTHFPLTAE